LEVTVKNIVRPELESLIPYKPGKPIFEVKRELGLEKIVKLASNESNLPPFPVAVKAMVDAVNNVNEYPDGGCVLLKEKLAPFMEVPETNIMVGNGSNELIRLLAMALLNPGDEVIFAEPSFVVYPTVTQMMNGIARRIPLMDFRHDLKSMKRAISAKTRLIFVCNPNNPTGTINHEDELDEFMQDMPDDILVVFDEAYYEFIDDPSFMSGMKYFKEDRLVAVLRTFSKIYSLAGCRIGYGVAPEFLCQAVNKIREPFNVNRVAQAGAFASLDDQKEVERRMVMNQEGKQYLYGKLDELDLKYVPTQANFILIDTGKDCREIFPQLLKEGIIVRTGDVFGYPTSIRVTIGTKDDNKKFIEALTKVLAAS
jgi:histidinol-phosphate aminotransferase